MNDKAAILALFTDRPSENWTEVDSVPCDCHATAAEWVVDALETHPDVPGTGYWYAPCVREPLFISLANGR